MPANPTQTFVTETDAVVAGKPDNDQVWVLAHFFEGDVYQWLTWLDVEELDSYGRDDEFELIEL
jgi:hypothetical protein